MNSTIRILSTHDVLLLTATILAIVNGMCEETQAIEAFSFLNFIISESFIFYLLLILKISSSGLHWLPIRHDRDCCKSWSERLAVIRQGILRFSGWFSGASHG